MYINTTTSQYPISENEIRTVYPNTSFPIPFIPPEEYVWVFPSPEPVYDPVTQFVRETIPELTNKGHWEQRWEVLPLDQEIVEAKTNETADMVRQKRNELLSSSDWTQLPDVPVDKPTWANYRQQLRDVTAQSGFPLEVTWPTPPV